MKEKRFYGWWIVVYCFLMIFVVLGFNVTLSIYLKPISESLGVDRTAISLLPTIIGLSSLMCMLVYGALSRVFGIKRLIIIGAFAVGGAYLVMSQTTNLTIFYICAAFIGMGYSFTTTIPLTAIVSNWFIERRGTVLGIIFAASGVGGFVFGPLIGNLIKVIGWSNSLFVQACIILTIGIPASLLIVENPSSRGQKPLGQQQAHDDIKNESDDKQEITTSMVFKSFSYWLTVLAVFIMATSVQMVTFSVPSFLTDIGIDVGTASFIVGCMLGVNALFKIIFGRIADRLGIGVVLLIIFVCYVSASLGLVYLPMSIMQFVFPLLMGAAIVLLTVPVPLFVQNLFGHKAYTSIMGIIMAAMALGIAVGPLVSSLIYERTDQYIGTFLIGAIVMVLVAGMLALADRLRIKV